MMQNATVSNITLSIMNDDYTLMFDQEAFSVPDSFNEDDIDIFAELGVTSGNPNNNPTAKPNAQEENLAILLSGNEVDEQKPPISFVESDLSADNFSLPDETISELLEILVKQELHSSEGKQIISNVPGKAKLNPSTAKVVKKQDEYEISVIIDVDGSGPVRPYAKIKSQNNILCLEDAPKSIPSTWIPLHDILRDILTKAMQMLSSTNFTIHNNA
jgi:hypothetical protein